MGGNPENQKVFETVDFDGLLSKEEITALQYYSKENYETDTVFQAIVSKFTDQAKQLKNGTLNAEDLTEENIALIQLSVSLFMLDGENNSQLQIDGEAKTLQSLINEITITDTSSTTPQQTEKNEKINSKERLELLGHSGQAYAEYIKELAGSMEGIADFGIPDQLYDIAESIELKVKDLRGNVNKGSINIEEVIGEIFPNIGSVYEKLKVAMVEDTVPEDIDEDKAPLINMNRIQNLSNAKTNRMFQRKIDKVTPYVQGVKSAFKHISSSIDLIEIEKTFYNNLNTLIKNDLNGSTLNRDAIKDRITDTGRILTEAQKESQLKDKLQHALDSIDEKTMKRLFGNKESVLEGALRHEFRNNENFDQNWVLSDVFDEVSDKILDMRENADSGMQRQVDNMKKELTHLIQKDPSTLSDQGRKRILKIKTLIDPANEDQLKKVYDESILITGINMLKVSAQNSVLENNKELWEGRNNNELTKLYADIEGVASGVLSDKNAQLLEDGAFMMASEIVLFASGMKLASVVTQGAIKLAGKAAVGQGIRQTATRATASAAGVTTGYGLNESGRSLVNDVPVEKWAEQYTFAKFATFGATLGILKLVQGMPSLQNINLKTTPISKAKALAKRVGFEEGALLGSEFTINGGELSAEDIIMAVAMGAAFESKFGLEMIQNAKYTRDVNGDILLDGLNGKDLLKAKRVKNSERTSKLIDKDHQEVIMANMMMPDNMRPQKARDLIPDIDHHDILIQKAHDEGGHEFGRLYIKEVKGNITLSEQTQLNKIRIKKRDILMNKEAGEGKGYSKDNANTLMDYGVVGKVPKERSQILTVTDRDSPLKDVIRKERDDTITIDPRNLDRLIRNEPLEIKDISRGLEDLIRATGKKQGFTIIGGDIIMLSDRGEAGIIRVPDKPSDLLDKLTTELTTKFGEPINLEEDMLTTLKDAATAKDGFPFKESKGDNGKLELTDIRNHKNFDSLNIKDENGEPAKYKDSNILELQQSLAKSELDKEAKKMADVFIKRIVEVSSAEPGKVFFAEAGKYTIMIQGSSVRIFPVGQTKLEYNAMNNSSVTLVSKKDSSPVGNIGNQANKDALNSVIHSFYGNKKADAVKADKEMRAASGHGQIIKENMKEGDAEKRLEGSAKDLGVERNDLTEQTSNAIIKAHKHGGERFGELYELEISGTTMSKDQKRELAQIRSEKRRIVEQEGGLTHDQSRVLMSNGRIGIWDKLLTNNTKSLSLSELNSLTLGTVLSYRGVDGKTHEIIKGNEGFYMLIIDGIVIGEGQLIPKNSLDKQSGISFTENFGGNINKLHSSSPVDGKITIGKLNENLGKLIDEYSTAKDSLKNKANIESDPFSREYKLESGKPLTIKDKSDLTLELGGGDNPYKINVIRDNNDVFFIKNGNEYTRIDSEVTIGRGDSNDIQLKNTFISNKHVRINLSNKPGEVEITDLNSTNGTVLKYKVTEKYIPEEIISDHMIDKANSYDGLFKVLKKYKTIGIYKTEHLINTINQYRKSGINIDTITRTNGLRKKVIALRNNEIIQKSTLAKLWPNGLESRTHQGNVGNCYFVATLNSIKNHSLGGEMLTKMVTPLNNGGFRVHFEGHNEAIIITKKDIDQMGSAKINSQNIGDIIIERAHARIVNGQRGGQSGHTMIVQKGKFNHEKGKLNHSSGHMDEVLKLFYGKNISTMTVAKDITDSQILKDFDSEQFKHVDKLNAGDYHETLKVYLKKGNFIGLASHSINDMTDINTYTGTDFNGNDVKIHYSHAYTVFDFNEKEGWVSVVNPHDSGKTMYFTIEQLHRNFPGLTVGQFND